MTALTDSLLLTEDFTNLQDESSSSSSSSSLPATATTVTIPHHATVTAEFETVRNLFAGTMGGFARVLTGQPFDTVKVRLQTSPHEYKNTSDVVRKIIKNEGFAAFYKGTLPPLLAVGVCGSLQFAAVESVKSHFRRENNGGALTHGQLYASGAFAGLVNSSISGPVEHIRSRLQIQTAKSAEQRLYQGPWDCIKKIYSFGGIRAIYRGQVPAVLRETKAYAGYFLTYELATQQMMKFTGRERRELNSGHIMFCGAIGGFGMWIPVFPIDVVKSRMQTDGFGAAQKYSGTLDCIRKTYLNDGMKGFFRGFTACVVRAAPVNAAVFLAFETSMRMMKAS